MARSLLHSALYVLAVVVLTGLYFLSNRLGLALQLNYGGLTPLWPAAGIGVALLWLYGLRWWPVIVLGELLSARFLGQGWLVGISGAMVQLVEGLLAAGLLTRFTVDARFEHSRDPIRFLLLGSLLPPVVSGGLGSVGLVLSGAVPEGGFPTAWFTWWLGDAMGILIVTPLIAHWRRWPFASRRTTVEWLGLLLLLAAGAGAVTLQTYQNASTLFFLLLPLAVLAAARGGAAGASSAAAVLALAVLAFTRHEVTDHFMAAVRILFVGATAFTGYLVAAAFAERHAVDAALNAEQDRALVTLQAIGDGVISTHPDGRVFFMNSVAERLTGWKADVARDHAIEDVFPLSPAGTDTDQEHTVRHCLAHGSNVELLRRRQLRDRTGTLRPVEGAITLVRGRDNRVLGGVVVFRDVSEAEHLREQLVREATHDSLTGLQNRASFDKRLRELTHGNDRSARHALLYLDLDQFKVINDTRGHEIGDRLLIELTRHLRALVHKPHIIARLGGDEFGVLMVNAGEPAAMNLAEALRRAVLDYRYQDKDFTYSVGMSIGIAFFSPGDRAADVLSRADMACYIAKESGRNAIHAYHTDDSTMLRRHSELTRVARLESAMSEGRLRLFGQRIVNLQQESDAGEEGRFYEVLLRLQEDDAIVAPGAFLPAAGRYGLSAVIDHWVLDQSFRFLGGKSQYGIRLSINLDARTLDHPDFHQQAMEYLARYKVPPDSVVFEVTENVALEHLSRAVETMHRLSRHGFRFALDDFGSGVASFGYLQELPVHFVKIDGRFVQNFAEDPANPLIIRTLVELARLRGIECIAECVENESARAELTRLGVTFAQGYFLHKPEPLPA